MTGGRPGVPSTEGGRAGMTGVWAPVLTPCTLWLSVARRLGVGWYVRGSWSATLHVH